MKQYTDAPITFTVEGVDMTQVTQPHVTFRQGDTVVDATDLNILDAGNFALSLTQAETSRFRVGAVKIQLNFFNSNGKRCASDIATVDAELNILKRVITDGD